MRFLLVEDSVELARSVRDLLALDGHGVDCAGTLSEAQDCLAAASYDLILLDIMLPDGDGRAFLQAQRRAGRDTPVIVMTARAAVSDRVDVLDSGADDYITKPFSQRLLIARIKAVLRRARSLEFDDAREEDIIEYDNLLLDPDRHLCQWKHENVKLTVTEFLMLKALIIHPGHVKSRDQLMDAAYGDSVFLDDRTIDSHIKRLRRKFRLVDPEFEQIETLYGIGYRFRNS